MNLCSLEKLTRFYFIVFVFSSEAYLTAKAKIVNQWALKVVVDTEMQTIQKKLGGVNRKQSGNILHRALKKKNPETK